MVTSEFKSASGLQMFRGMKAVAVVIVAMLALTGCGVGEGEYWDGEKLVDANGQALSFDNGGSVAATANVADAASVQTSITTGIGCATNLRDPGTVALPQDPIPVQPYPRDQYGNPIIPAALMPPMPSSTPMAK